MRPEQAPFPAVWMSFLPYIMTCGNDSFTCPYEFAPPLDASLFRSDFHWLRETEPVPYPAGSIYRSGEARAIADKFPNLVADVSRLGLTSPEALVKHTFAARLRGLNDDAKALGFTLPAAYITFMSSPELQARMPSSAGCHFVLPQGIFKSPAGDNGYMLRFLHDYEDAWFWFLYLAPNGDHCVVWGRDWMEGWLEHYTDPTRYVLNNTYIVGPTFEETMYRYWIETSISLAHTGPGLINKLDLRRPLTEVEQAYLDKCKPYLKPLTYF